MSRTKNEASVGLELSEHETWKTCLVLCFFFNWFHINKGRHAHLPKTWQNWHFYVNSNYEQRAQDAFLWQSLIGRVLFRKWCIAWKTSLSLLLLICTGDVPKYCCMVEIAYISKINTPLLKVTAICLHTHIPNNSLHWCWKLNIKSDVFISLMLQENQIMGRGSTKESIFV